jgi:outer membrane protein assembly factor BamB
MIFVRRSWAPGAALILAVCSMLLVALISAGCGATGAPSTTAGSRPETTLGSSSTTADSSGTTAAGGTTAPGGNTTSSPAGGAAGGSTTSATTGGQSGGDWPTYHHDAARTGTAGDQAALGNVKQAWKSTSLDGAIYAQPLFVGGRVFVATEGNTVYALDASSGAVVWKQNLGESVPGGDLPCGNIDPSGITGTPVIDPANGIIYVVANLRSGPHHELFALGLSDGSVRWYRAIDPPGLGAAVEQQRGALTLSGGRIYVPYGGLYGDCGQYKGTVLSVAADGSDLAAYIVPTARMAGIWNPAGPVVDSAGDLWVTTGNSAGQNTFDFGNALIRLNGQLQVTDYFAPSNWAQLNAGDVDLGSLGPVLLPNERVLAMGKDGIAYLLDAANLGHVGNPLASLRVGASAFGTAATTGTHVFAPTTGALVALAITGDKLSVAWKVSGGSCPPIVAAGVVWALGYDGALRAADPATGKVVFSAQLGNPVSRFVSPAAGGGKLFVPDGNALVAFTLR